jgi:uncharacterized protein (TIGR00730 family)
MNHAKSRKNHRHANSIKPSQAISVCVYCGSGKGLNPRYAEAARIFGAAMAKAGVRLVYGGGSNGLMGEIARAVLAEGGQVNGVIPQTLIELEPPLREAQELTVVRDLHERKMLMFQRSDAFVALPGGLGTLEELVEQLTWVQVGHHAKPIVIANIEGYWTPLLRLFDEMRAETFIRPGLEARFLLADKAEDILPTALAALAATPPQRMSQPPPF